MKDRENGGASENDRDDQLAHASCLAMERTMNDVDGIRFLYFAYGSNLDLAQMTRRCSDPRVVGRATLPGYRIAFAGMSVTWEGKGVATIMPVQGGRVDGLLYELNAADVERLDSWEGCPTAYDHQEVVIRAEQGRERRAFVYAKRHRALRPNPPGELYLGVLRREYARLGFDPAPLELAAREAA